MVYRNPSVRQDLDRKGKPWRAIIKYTDPETGKQKQKTKALPAAKSRQDAKRLADEWLVEMNETGSATETRTIPYPEKYKDRLHDSGASAFSGKTDHPNSRYYVINDFYNMKSDDTLHILTHFQTYQQTTEYTCGAACSLMVLNWFGQKKYHEMLVGQLIESIPEKGSSVECIADFFDLIGFDVDFHADTSLRFQTPKEFERYVIDCIDAKTPVLVDWVDWAGHWQVIIGIDTCGTEEPYDDVLILADPYDVTNHFQDGYYIFPLARFFYMWREGPCAHKAEPYQQPFVAARPRVPGKEDPEQMHGAHEGKTLLSDFSDTGDRDAEL